jgi:hypothetical protein
MEFRINNEAKVQSLKVVVQTYEQELYKLLIILGIDADAFDPNSWDKEINMETQEGKVQHYIDLINDVEQKITELQ